MILPQLRLRKGQPPAGVFSPELGGAVCGKSLEGSVGLGAGLPAAAWGVRQAPEGAFSAPPQTSEELQPKTQLLEVGGQSSVVKQGTEDRGSRGDSFLPLPRSARPSPGGGIASRVRRLSRRGQSGIGGQGIH